MENSDIIDALSALAQRSRLPLFRQLMAALPAGIPAGDLAKAHGIPASTLSTHLAILAQTGLISAERQGRTILYRAEADRLAALMVALARDCCLGRPDICTPLIAALDPCNCT